VCEAKDVAESDPYLMNMTAAVALGVSTEITSAVEMATGLSLKEVAALTTLANCADRDSINASLSSLFINGRPSAWIEIAARESGPTCRRSMR
jgi:hypothetical protein